jgi:hypothetical protein
MSEIATPPAAAPAASSTPPAGAPPAGSPPPTALGAAAASEPQGQQPPAGTPPSPAPFTFTKFIKPDGAFDFSDIGTLPDGDEKAFAAHTLAKYKNVDEAMKAFRHVNGLVGAKGLLPLPATATPQEREAFNKRLGEVLGIPKDAAGYGIKKPDDMPAEAWSDEHATAVAEIARKNNIPPAAMQELVAAQNEFVKKSVLGQQQAQEQATQQAFGELQQEWGDRYNANLVLAARSAKTLGLDVNDPTIGNNPGMIRAMHKFASLVSEHSLVTGGEMSSGPGLEVQLQEHNASILGQPWGKDPNHPSYQAWSAKQAELSLKVAEARSKGGRR